MPIPAVQVVARVANGQLALDELKRTPVDVLVLDIEMPVMDGMTALPLLLRADPGLKVIMASTLTTRGADIALRALRLGAADYVPKPSAVHRRRDVPPRAGGKGEGPGPHAPPRRAAGARDASRCGCGRPAIVPPRLLAVGSSTGGPQALFTLVQGLGKTLNVPVVLTQHMPRDLHADPRRAHQQAGRAAVRRGEGRRDADGRPHLSRARRPPSADRCRPRSGLQARLTTDPPENFCRPSVDPMLRSAAAACDGRVLVAMLTGMGQDGLAGTRRVIEAGGSAVAQDEATSVVWGMPGAVAQAGLCHAVLPLPRIAPKLLEMLRMARA